MAVYNTLIPKLESFIKKYYQNQLLKGAILGISLVFAAFFALSFFEYLARFGTTKRTFLFYTFVLLCLAVIGWYIIRPILGLINVNRKFGTKEASQLIGNHFPQVKDKLINTLQLQKEAEQDDNDLLFASIEQRTASLQPIPFTNAIPYKSNLKYVMYALLPATALGFVLLVSPDFKKSSERVVNFNQHYEIEAPFDFITNLDKQQAIQNQTIEIPLTLEGTEIPTAAYIFIGSQRYKMKSDKPGEFRYILINMQRSEKVYFEAGGFTSKEYNLDLALKPSLYGYSALLSYPKYLCLANEKVRNIGELSVPQGTTIQWQFDTKNVDYLSISPDNIELQPKDDKTSFTKRFMRSTLLKVKTKNIRVNEGDSLFYQINVVPDEFPQISVECKTDSLINKTVHFLGDI